MALRSSSQALPSYDTNEAPVLCGCRLVLTSPSAHPLVCMSPVGVVGTEGGGSISRRSSEYTATPGVSTPQLHHSM